MVLQAWYRTDRWYAHKRAGGPSRDSQGIDDWYSSVNHCTRHSTKHKIWRRFHYLWHMKSLLWTLNVKDIYIIFVIAISHPSQAHGEISKSLFSEPVKFKADFALFKCRELQRTSLFPLSKIRCCLFMRTQEIKQEGKILSICSTDTSLDYKTYLKFLWFKPRVTRLNNPYYATFLKETKI